MHKKKNIKQIRELVEAFIVLSQKQNNNQIQIEGLIHGLAKSENPAVVREAFELLYKLRHGVNIVDHNPKKRG